MSRLQEKYQNELAGEIQKKLGLKNPMEVPRITKITLNMGVGEAVGDKKVMDRAVGDMTAVAGQKPIVTYARKSVASFKIRKKRIFRMSPIHHHFELKGWKESQVITRFWILSMIFAFIGLATLKLR